MKITLHGVVTTICLLVIIGMVKTQGGLIREHSQIVANAKLITDFHDERLISLENTIIPGVCIRPKTAVLKRGLNNTVVFSVKTCDGKTLKYSRSLDIRA